MYLKQKITLALQWGNAASILGALPLEGNLDSIFSARNIYP
jgi:hypothetical protein